MKKGNNNQPKFIDPALLPDNAYGHETGYYVLRLSPDELAERKDRLVKLSVNIDSKETEEKDRKAAFKKEITPIRDEAKIVLGECKTGVKELHGTMYLMTDQENAIMEVYSQEGWLLSTRPLLQDERQLQITHKKEATND